MAMALKATQASPAATVAAGRKDKVELYCGNISPVAPDFDDPLKWWKDIETREQLIPIDDMNLGASVHPRAQLACPTCLRASTATSLTAQVEMKGRAWEILFRGWVVENMSFCSATSSFVTTNRRENVGHLYVRGTVRRRGRVFCHEDKIRIVQDYGTVSAGSHSVYQKETLLVGASPLPRISPRISRLLAFRRPKTWLKMRKFECGLQGSSLRTRRERVIWLIRVDIRWRSRNGGNVKWSPVVISTRDRELIQVWPG
ncbi:hypothetical protein B0H13DRAFT_1900597 [Mycena leptocephala]|nr:hypothetical protein B0H13DRAFT_1900597 [Mycena leptocephala]